MEAQEIQSLAALEDKHWWYKERRALLRRELKGYPPGRALDVGAAVGGNTRVLRELGWQALETLRHRQASALAYFDCFWIFAMIMLFLVPVVLLMKRSVAEKGARAEVE